MATSGSQIPYDPLLEPPRSPRLPPDSEFGAPNPHFYDPTSRASSMAYRDSEYGSIAALRDSNYGALPPGAGTPYRDNPNATRDNLPMSHMTPERNNLSEKHELYAAPRTKTKRTMLFWLLIAAGVLIVLVAIIVPVYLFVIKKSGDDDDSGSGNNHGNHHTGDSGDSEEPPVQTVITSGADGSIVTKEDGSTFVYNNTFGGFWVYDPANPLNQSARAQSYTPPLTEQWNWGVDKMYGVNIGGWLNLEPFISPALYEPFFPNAVDEWTLSELIQQRDGNLDAIEEHYKTFIVEEDFAQIAAAGLNWVRIPLPFWAIEKTAEEPFLERVCWNYFLKAIEWSRKYGLRINLDLHAISGSQNGWNHSGKLGQTNFLTGTMGLANAQRTLDHIRILTEFISQPEYKDIVPFFGIMNEPRGGTGSFSQADIAAFYAEAYRVIRNAGGTGAGNGPFISIHEAFFGLGEWSSFLTGADRIALDSHPYMAFGGMSAAPVEAFIPQPCTNWGGLFSSSQSSFGLTAAGEWSLAINDCGLYLNAVGRGTRYEGTFESTTVIGSCDQWTNYEAWDAATKDSLRELALSTMDALQNWFFWTWRIGESAASGKVETPFWSYKLGLQEGYMPTDPREHEGQCQRVAGTAPFTGALQSWQVGGTGAGVVPSLDTYEWPPAALAASPAYTATGPIVTLPVPTFTSADPSVTVGSGWTNPADTTPMAVPVAGCVYPDPWDALAAAPPACALVAAKRDAAPGPTPVPL